MNTAPFPEIAESDLKAVRDFLTSVRDEQRAERAPKQRSPRGDVALRHGITRARARPRSPGGGAA